MLVQNKKNYEDSLMILSKYNDDPLIYFVE